MPERAMPPVLVLLSDGKPSDDFDTGLRELLEQPWGKKAVRIAIAIGKDADHAVLQQFIARPDLEPLQANNPQALVQHIRWVSTAVLQAATAPASSIGNITVPLANVPIPAPPDPASSAVDDVW
jgi:uncharacterized protein YegL